MLLIARIFETAGGARMMNATMTDDLTEVLDRVKTWSVTSRIALVKGVLETFTSDTATDSAAPTVAPSSEEIRRTYQTDRDAPSDETIRRWKHEHLMEKYG